MKGKTANGIKNKSELIPPNSAGISVLHCDILDNEDLERLSQTILDTFNGIDIVIDNATKGIFNAVNKDDCRAFIDGTSEQLRTTINVSLISTQKKYKDLLWINFKHKKNDLES